MILAAAIGTGVIFAGDTRGQGTKSIAPLNFSENYREAPLSSQGLCGVLAVGYGVPDPSHLYVWIPKHYDSCLRIEVASADGLYEASAEYNISGIESGKYRLDFPTKRNSIIAAYRYRELAVLATLHKSAPGSVRDADALGDGIIVAGWGKNVKSDSIVVLFSSGGADYSEFMTTQNGNDSSLECSPVPNQRVRYKAVYDFQCQLKLTRNIAFEKAFIARQNAEGVQLKKIPVPIRVN